MKYLLDTNIISAVLKGNNKVKEKIQRQLWKGDNIIINAITYYEIKRGLIAAGASKKLKDFKLICSLYTFVLLDSKDVFDIASEMYARLKTSGKRVNDADILIAAIALFHGAVVVTNDNDFKRIADLYRGLQIVNWIKE